MPALNFETLDDTLLHELVADFSGGQASFSKPDVIDPNQAAYIQNCYIHYSGQLRKRRGTRNLEDGFVDSAGKRIQGGIYYKTNTIDKLLSISNGMVYEYVESSNLWNLYFDADINDINEPVDIVQLTDQLYWTDSGGAGVRNWDGAAATTIPDSPEATILVSFTNRLIASGVPSIPDGIYFGDFLDGDTWTTTNILRIGAEGDPIIALKPWQDHFLLVFKEKSTWVIDINPTLAVAQFEIKLIHSTIGCAAKRSICQVGQDVFFLSRSGVMSVQKQIATSNNVIPIPVSYDLTDIVNRINWEYAYKAAAVFYKNLYLLALPITSIEPETCIVYSSIQQAWAGVWSGPNIVFLMEQPYLGATRLIIGTDTGEVKTSRDTISDSEDLPESFLDGIGALTLPVILDAEFPEGAVVESELVTRAMFFGEPFNPKSGWYLEAEFEPQESEIEISVILDGGDPVILDNFTFGPRVVKLPADLPFALQPPRWHRKKYPIFQLGRFRSIQVIVRCPRGNLILRSLYLCSFLDTVELDQRISIL